MNEGTAKALLHRYIDEVWHRSNPAAIDEFLAPNYRRHRAPTSPPLTRAEQKRLLERFRAAFPDVTISVEDVIAEGDRVAFRSTMRGTHQGEFLGVAPTGREVIFGLLDIFRIQEGRVVEQWGGPDLHDLQRQLGPS